MSCCLHRKLDIFPACLPLGLQAASLWQRRSRPAWPHLTTAFTRNCGDANTGSSQRLQRIPSWGNWSSSAEKFDLLWSNVLSGKDRISHQTIAWKGRRGFVLFKILWCRHGDNPSLENAFNVYWAIQMEKSKALSIIKKKKKSGYGIWGVAEDNPPKSLLRIGYILFHFPCSLQSLPQ